MAWKLRKYPLLRQSAEYESLQKLLVKIRWQIGFRVCRCDICNRLVDPFAYRGCQKGVDLARMRPADYDCHPRDLSAIGDLVSYHWVEVGTGGKQRAKVGQHVVLPDEGTGPVEFGVQGASHHLAPVVDAGGEGRSISRRSAEVCDWTICAVQPNPSK